MWTVGQAVGAVSRNSTYKGEVIAINSDGRAMVRLSHFGREWTREFEANGKRFPLHSDYAKLHTWNAQLEMRHVGDCARHAASVQRTMANEADYREGQQLKKDAAEYLLDLLKDRNSPQADAARAFVLSHAPGFVFVPVEVR